MASARILIVDDEPDIRELIGEILADEGHEVLMAADASEARELRGQSQPDLVLLDVWMPGTDGISLLREWRESDTLDCPVVMISGHGSVEAAVEATRLGAFDFIEKPVSMAKLLVTVGNALEAGRLKRENAGLRSQAPTVMEPIGRSLAVQQLKRRLERIAAHDTPVLIQGEAGVGKAMAARWIHAHSKRSGGPFIVVPARSEGQDWTRALMGAEGQPGLIDQARGGVLFVEDVSRLDKEAQSALLGQLESGRLESASEDQGRALDIRLIAGTSVELEKLVQTGRFDEQLYFRLNVVPLELPPLRERQEDVPDLVRFYAEYFPNRDGVPYRHFSVAAQNRLRQHHWPGNLLELKNLVQRLLILGGDDEVSVAEVEEALSRSVEAQRGEGGDAVPALFHLPLREAREEFERQYLTYKLKSVDGSVGKLAEVVEMERTHLYRKLRQLGIDPKQI
ncbi:sigma-54-dependent transcriptional regulator [Wenzhouxiangella marina]|uniref:Two component, sigma54 specific, transcriptional regulator, Fis family n=1 Tax=Wenzhouxiangella marina TaxID=1579979 RepID=A0A0K0XST2_9GAMM|nr:sigma-54 dependent transcriptional regulator [Wenzhouxiangella marina]AKS40705.1 Two component, sigma54 specific, transcriptional regulator, Fis family [Wenzhouxiangella marina]MBB6088477.1 DNA-binding NtrC family response regulator [Wenzhouxiangella marina]